MSDIRLVGFDGDDTLWRSEDYYRSAEKRYGRDWADTFFRRDDGSAGAADDPTPPSPPPTP